VPAVSFDFLDRRRAERFAELLDETNGGRRQHSRVPADEGLAELVAIGHSLPAARPGVRVDPEFRAGLRAMLVATAERDGIGRTASTAATEPVSGHAATARSGLRAGLLGRGGRRIRARGAIVIGVAAGAMAVSGISAASENASPGDALYGVKRSTERAQLAMAGSDVTRGQLSLDFARTRLAEAASMSGGDAGFAGVLDDMDADTRKGVKLLNTAAVARRDTKPLATIDDFAARQRQTLTPVLERLTSANRERAMGSLGLLDAAHERADDLRTGLSCTPVTPAGSDVLGPKLRDCTTNAEAPATTRPSGQTGKATTKAPGKDATKAPATKRSSGPAAKPGVSADAPAPTRSKAATTGDPDEPMLGGDADQPTQSADPYGTEEQPFEQDESSGLGGLLGGIF
jgi:Domain of unknown function (DUF5667)